MSARWKRINPGSQETVLIKAQVLRLALP